MRLGREQQVSALNKTWTISRFTNELLFAFRDWIAVQEGDVYAAAERFIDRIKDDGEKIKLIKECQDVDRQLKGFSLSSAIAQRYLSTETGQIKLWQLLLEAKHPGTSSGDAFEVAQAYGEQLMSERKLQEQRLAETLKDVLPDIKSGKLAPDSLASLIASLDHRVSQAEATSAMLETAQGRLPNGEAPQEKVGASL
jgi:hypothetical protein